MFYEQLKLACEQKGLSVTALLNKMGLSTSNTGKWKNGGFPSVDILIKLSSELDVTTDYLLTGKQTTVSDSIQQSNHLSPIESELLEILHRFSDGAEQHRFISEVYDIADKLKGPSSSKRVSS